MEIEKLHIMPELERNEANDGYIYPEKYQNRLFEMDEYYIYFKKNKIDTFSKTIFDSVIESSLEHKLKQISTIISENSTIIIENLLQEKLNSTFININSSLENWTHKIDSKIDLSDLQTFREEINIAIKQLTDHISNIHQSEIVELTEQISVPIIDDKIIDNKISEANIRIMEYIDQALTKLSNKISDMTTYTDNKINDELNIVQQNMVSIIKENIGSFITHTTSIKSGELSLSKLSAMKELGFSVDDIIKLNSEGLL
jgi:hypothetical protein